MRRDPEDFEPEDSSPAGRMLDPDAQVLKLAAAVMNVAAADAANGCVDAALWLCSGEVAEIWAPALDLNDLAPLHLAAPLLLAPAPAGKSVKVKAPGHAAILRMFARKP